MLKSSYTNIYFSIYEKHIIVTKYFDFQIFCFRGCFFYFLRYNMDINRCSIEYYMSNHRFLGGGIYVRYNTKIYQRSRKRDHSFYRNVNGNFCSYSTSDQSSKRAFPHLDYFHCDLCGQPDSALCSQHHIPYI